MQKASPAERDPSLNLEYTIASVLLGRLAALVEYEIVNWLWRAWGSLEYGSVSSDWHLGTSCKN
ncbi:hypothetical protein N7509_012702 [Penicillium cosmopolitanum]|uniref:Uncharacterized protein n=1 Tax=Penicillium cosmopolitanum TaxID=1131564 RepID=A0A9W9VEW9_9EURO|nr:uncharacterized protein N7509_012702 [Penicillium cosmopolitanum]KAJ5379583.1 hypothetical protein N7509_012702 [Penicillium cosmopolitanum]